MPDPQQVVYDSIRFLLQQKKITDVEITRSAHIQDDLRLDSLDLAELSATLEDDLGRDPYSAGLLPVTVNDLLAFYDA